VLRGSIRRPEAQILRPGAQNRPPLQGIH
jgi:hypothetical protein